MLLLILGAFDILVGFALLSPDLFSSIIFYIGIGVLVKGLFSFGGSILSKRWFDWMGIIDLVAGASIILAIQIPYLWILPILKGFYTVLFLWGK